MHKVLIEDRDRAVMSPGDCPGVYRSQAYHPMGPYFKVDVICHILSYVRIFNVVMTAVRTIRLVYRINKYAPPK